MSGQVVPGQPGHCRRHHHRRVGGKGVKVDMILTNGSDTSTTKQVADLEELYSQGLQGLILFPGDSIVLAEPVKNIFNKQSMPGVVTDVGL